MEVLGVIPARYGSTRFPGKPLAKIAGRPMLQWVVEAAKKSQKLTDVLVATDDERIMELADEVGVKAVMTGECATGSDRIWQAAKDREEEIIVNIQGDEPLLEPELIDRLVEPFFADSHLKMATLGRRLQREDLDNPNTAKIVLNDRNQAIYFSRLPIPYTRQSLEEAKSPVNLKHIGLYAYRRGFLEHYVTSGPCALEEAEGLEQLRALYLRARIQVVEVEAESWGVDAPDDIAKIEAILKSK